MHPTRRRIRPALIALVTAALSSAAHAVTYYKANNTTSLTNLASWWLDDIGTTPAVDAPVNTTSPTAVCIWNNLVTGPNTIALVDVGIQTIRVLNPGGPIVMDAGVTARTLTVGNGGGIDMSQATQDLTFENMFYRSAASGISVGINVAAGRTLTFGSNAQLNVRSNASNVTININNDGTSAGTVKFGANFGPSHVVIGGGRVEFNRAGGNTRLSTHTTTLNNGTLVVSNTSGSATGTGVVTLNAGTLTGTGIINGATTAGASAILAPGENTVGTLTIGSLNLTAGSTIVWEAENASSADKIAVTGTDGLVINGGTIKLYQPGTTTPFNGVGTFTLFSQVGAIGGTGLSALTIDESTKIAGRTYSIGQSAGLITLSIIDGAITNTDWNTDADGNWSAGANWTGGVAPAGAMSVARVSGAGIPLSAPRTLTLDAPTTINSLMLDAAQSVTLAGAATLTLDAGGAAATIAASVADHQIQTPIALSTGGMLASVDASRTLTLSGVVAGDNLGLVKDGEGTLLLAADNTYTGSTSVGSGTLAIGNGGTSGAIAGPIVNSGTLRFNRSDSIAPAGVISGSGSVEFTGTGDTTLSLANTYSGSTTLSAGTLVLANSNALQNSTFNYSILGGSLVIADTLTTLNLGGLAGDRALPLTNVALAPIALTVGGNNASTTYSGSPAGSGTSLTKNGTGTLTLNGAHAYSGAATINNGTLAIGTGGTFTTTAAILGTGTSATLSVTGGVFTASGASSMNNNAVGVLVSGGEANFNGGFSTEANNSAGDNFISVSGGVLNASTISTSRGSLSITSEPTSGQTTQGIYVNGGALNISGALSIGTVSGANSSVTARMDSGSLTVGGPLTVGINNTGRWSVLDINGGTLDATDASGISIGGPFAGQVIMHVRGSGVVKTPRIQFGQGALAGKSYLSLGGGALYVGSGGMVVGSTDAGFLAGLRLGSGILGASADWSGTLPVSLTSITAVVTGADEANTPHTITLSGPLTGPLGSGVTKSGAGTVHFTSSANDYYGPTLVEAGTLGMGGKTTDLVTVNPGAALQPHGTLTAEYGATIDGALNIVYSGSAPTTVPGLVSPSGTITLGAASSLIVTGTGNLPGPAYVILKSGTAVIGTFGSISLPAWLTVDYAYDDDSNPATPAVVALVGGVSASPYDAWTASFSLTGEDALASADPDQDGFANLLEFALATSPTAANVAPWTIARSGNVLSLSFAYPANSGLTYSVEATDDLAGAWTTVQTYPAFTTAGTATYTDTADFTVTPRRFLRVKVTPAP